MSGVNGPGAALVSNYLARKRMGNPTEYKNVLPICSALEIQSHKNALQLCLKAIKKQPDNYLVLTFKALALSQAPRPLSNASTTEIMSIFNFIMSNANGAGLDDADVLLFLGWVLGSIGQHQEVLTMLAKATTLFSANEDVCIEAFLHYTRVGERKSAQQISMKMQRNFKTTRYLWWSVMAVLLQVRDLKNSTNTILLSLAERQISEHYNQIKTQAQEATAKLKSGKLAVESSAPTTLDKGKGKATALDSPSDSPIIEQSIPSIQFENAHEFHLITRFLELRVLNAEAKESTSTSKPLNLPQQSLILPSIITNPELPQTLKEVLLAHFSSQEGDRWCERSLGLEIWRRECELKYGSLEGNDWKKSWERLEKSLQKGDSNWHTMLYLIRCAFAVASGSSSSFYGEKSVESELSPSEEGKLLISESRELFRTFADDGEKGRKERGYLLGLLEIARESRTRSWVEDNSILDLMEEYIERFSAKMCCFDDLKPYLESLSVEERSNLYDKLILKDSSKHSSVTKAQREISQAKLVRFLDTILTEESESLQAEKFLTKYFETLPLGKGLPITELQPADDFALLAAQSLVTAWDISHERKYLEKAAAILDLATSRSKYKYQLRILLVNILRLLGASTLAITNYNTLDIKSVQFDTLAHLIMTRASTFSLAQNSNDINGGIIEAGNSALKWYKTGLHEAREMPVRAVSTSNHTMVEDFITFQERLATSLSKDLLIIENLRIHVLAGNFDSKSDIITLVSNIKSSHSDNRDFKTLPNLQPATQTGIWKQVSMGPVIGADWLKGFVTIYSNFLLPVVEEEVGKVENDSATAELTESENALLAFSKIIRKTLNSNLEDTTSEELALEFFKDQEIRFVKALEDLSTLPWELLHIAQITFEGSCLLGLAVEDTLAELMSKKSPESTKQMKRWKTFKTTADGLVRQLSSKITSYGKQVGKSRSKTMLNLAGLEQFPLMDEDILLNFAHSLTDSRKSMVEGMASAIHRRLK